MSSTSSSTSGTIRISGMASGLDTQSVITALLNVRKVPITALQDKVKAEVTQVTEWNSLSDAISSLDDIVDQLVDSTTWTQMSCASSNEDVATASITDSTEVSSGKYTLVVSTLAAAQSGYSDSVSSTTADLMGTSTATYTINGTEVTISANSTLSDIVTAINNKTSTTNVKAEIVNNKLVLENSTTGTGHDMTVKYTSGTKNIFESLNLMTFSDGTGSFISGKSTASANLAGTLNGIAISSSTNKPTDIISGMTFDISETGTTVLTVSHDTDTITTLMTDFVSEYNDLMKRLTTDGSVNLSSGSDSISSVGILQGDSLLTRITSKLFNVLSTSGNFGGSLTSLYAAGIWYKDGSSTKLEVDSDKLSAALKNNFDSFKDLVRGWGSSSSSTSSNTEKEGVFRTLESYITDLIDPSKGIVTSKINDLNTKMTTQKAEIKQKQSDMTKYEDYLWNHFSAMETAVESIQAQGNYVASLTG